MGIRKSLQESQQREAQQDKEAARLSGYVKSLGAKHRGKVSRVSDDHEIMSDVTEWIPSGFPSVDAALGGGWPVGRASEVYGKEASGKTALAHYGILQAQKMGGFGVLVDAENSLTRHQLDTVGLDPDRLIQIRPDHMEEVFDALKELLHEIQQNPPDSPVFFAWDSVAVTRSKVELDRKSAEDSVVGNQARVMAEQCNNQLLNTIGRCRAHVMFINQVRDAIGAGPYAEVHTPGGRALKFIVSTRVHCSKRSNIPATGNPKTGLYLKVHIKKNKVARPFKTGYFAIDYDLGPCPAIAVFEELKSENKIKSAGGGKYQLTVGNIDLGEDAKFTRHRWREMYDESESLRRVAADAITGRSGA